MQSYFHSWAWNKTQTKWQDGVCVFGIKLTPPPPSPTHTHTHWRTKMCCRKAWTVRSVLLFKGTVHVHSRNFALAPSGGASMSTHHSGLWGQFEAVYEKVYGKYLPSLVIVWCIYEESEILLSSYWTWQNMRKIQYTFKDKTKQWLSK